MKSVAAGGHHRRRVTQVRPYAAHGPGIVPETLEGEIGVQAVELGQRFLGTASRVAGDRADAPKDSAPLRIPLAGEARDIFRDPGGDEAFLRPTGFVPGIDIDQ